MQSSENYKYMNMFGSHRRPLHLYIISETSQWNKNVINKHVMKQSLRLNGDAVTQLNHKQVYDGCDHRHWLPYAKYRQPFL